MTHPCRLCSAILLAVAPVASHAQPVAAPLTVTLPFTEMGGKLGNANLNLALSDVTVSPNWILLNSTSSFQLDAPNKDLPEGSYTIRFGIKQSSGAGSLQLSANGAQSTCPFSMQQSYTGPVQYCSIGPVAVVGPSRLLRVNGSLAGSRPQSWQIGDVTVTKVQ